MKIRLPFVSPRKASACRSLGLLGLALAVVALPPLHAQGGTRACQRPGSGEYAAGADEGIGSLPLVMAPTPFTPLGDLIPDAYLSPTGETRAFVQLRGGLDRLRDVLLDARGDGIVTLHPPASPAGEWVMGLHGRINAELDPQVLSAGDLHLGIRSGMEFSDGTGAVCWNGWCTPVTLTGGGGVFLPIAALLQAGSLFQDDLRFVAQSVSMTVARIDVALGKSGNVEIRQVFE